MYRVKVILRPISKQKTLSKIIGQNAVVLGTYFKMRFKPYLYGITIDTVI